jgi:hypothetical protein
MRGVGSAIQTANGSSEGFDAGSGGMVDHLNPGPRYYLVDRKRWPG